MRPDASSECPAPRSQPARRFRRGRTGGVVLAGALLAAPAAGAQQFATQAPATRAPVQKSAFATTEAPEPAPAVTRAAPPPARRAPAVEPVTPVEPVDAAPDDGAEQGRLDVVPAAGKAPPQAPRYETDSIKVVEKKKTARDRDREHNEPDVLLDVPNLGVDEITLDVENLRAHLALDTRLANLLQLTVGADVSIDRVYLTIRGVKAEAYLSARLDNVAGILDRALTTIDRNPQIIDSLFSTLDNTVNTVGKVADTALQPGGVVSEAVQTVGSVANTALQPGGVVSEAVQTVGSVANNALQPGGVVSQAVNTVGQVANTAVQPGGVLSDAVHTVGNVATTTVGTVGNVANQAVATVGETANTALQPHGVLAQTVGTVGDVAGQTVGTVGTAAGQTVNAVGNVAGQTVSTAGTVAGQTVGTLAPAVTAATGAAGNLAQQGGASAAGDASALPRVPQVISKLLQPAGDLAVRTIDHAGNIVELLYDAGGRLASERFVANVMRLTPLSQVRNAAGHVVRQVRDDSGALLEYELSGPQRLSAIRLLVPGERGVPAQPPQPPQQQPIAAPAPVTAPGTPMDGTTAAVMGGAPTVPAPFAPDAPLPPRPIEPPTSAPGLDPRRAPVPSPPPAAPLPPPGAVGSANLPPPAGGNLLRRVELPGNRRVDWVLTPECTVVERVSDGGRALSERQSEDVATLPVVSESALASGLVRSVQSATGAVIDLSFTPEGALDTCRVNNPSATTAAR